MMIFLKPVRSFAASISASGRSGVFRPVAIAGHGADLRPHCVAAVFLLDAGQCLQPDLQMAD